MTRTSLRFSTRYLFILLLASSAPGCTFLSGIEDTKKEKDKARTFDDPGSAGTGGAAAGAGGQPTVNLDGGSGGSDAGLAGSDAGGAAGSDAAGGEGGSS